MANTTTRKRQAAARAVAAEPVPTPSAAYRSWFPAIVSVPVVKDGVAGRYQHNNVKVFATPEGVYVYDQVPLEPRQDGVPTPKWFAPVNYGKTPEPPRGIKERNGVTLVTDQGAVVITPLGGCGCGMRKLRDWSPSWASVVQTWPTTEEG